MHGRLVKLMDDVLAPALQPKDEGEGGEEEDGGNEGTASGKKVVTTRDIHDYLVKMMDDVLAPMSDNENGPNEFNRDTANTRHFKSIRSENREVATRDIHGYLIELMDDVLAPTSHT
jgi:hypothetical protein